MRISEKYSLSGRLEFEDFELSTDNRKWIDPFMMHMDKSEFGRECCSILKEYFGTLLAYARNNDKTGGKKITKKMIEINEVRIGYSEGAPGGHSGGKKLGLEIMDLIYKSDAIYSGMISDIFDSCILIENFGIDKLSDFITTIILEKLIEFTQIQSTKHNIPLIEHKFEKAYWSAKDLEWKEEINIFLPYDEDLNMAIIFVPVNFVEKKNVFDYRRFYNKGMVPYYSKQAIDDRTSGLVKILKDNTIKPLIGEIKKRYPCTKPIVANFIREKNEVYLDYKEQQLNYTNYQNYKNSSNN